MKQFEKKKKNWKHSQLNLQADTEGNFCSSRTKEDLVQAYISFMLIQMMCIKPFQLEYFTARFCNKIPRHPISESSNILYQSSKAPRTKRQLDIYHLWTGNQGSTVLQLQHVVSWIRFYKLHDTLCV